MLTSRPDFCTDFSPVAKTRYLPFAQQFPLQYIQGEKGCRLAYRHFIHTPLATKRIILVNGRAENILKWTIPAWHFYQQGFDVLVMDHRGQGYSERLLSHPQKGHIDAFHFYVADLDKVIRESTLIPNQTQYLLGHSMGGLISSYYLAHYPHPIQKAVLSAPFFGIPSQHPLRDQCLVTLMQLFAQGHRYIIGHKNYRPKHPINNDLTHASESIQWQNAIIAHSPQLALGGATFRWVQQCWQAIHSLPKVLPHIDIPLLILEAGEDRVVNNHSLPKLCSLIPQGQLQLIPNARHEILFEKPNIHAPIFAQLFRFFHTH